MRGLRAWAYRNRWLAQLVDAKHERRKAKAFQAHLAASIGEAIAWRERNAAIACAREQLRLLQAIPHPPSRKGSPVMRRIREPFVDGLQHTFGAAQVGDVSSIALDAALNIASIDPAELSAFRLYLAVLWLHNERCIAMLRSATSEHIVLHMSCVARLERAERSIESFAAATACAAQHLKLVGTASDYQFDATTGLLGVPADDTYECLPEKVFEAFAILTLARNPACILKLDDDHRLKDNDALERLLTFMASSREPLQAGEVNRTRLPSAHHRAWHFDKCARPELNGRALSLPTPSKWAAGSSGYVVNRAALWRLLWASTYYTDWLEDILYEDIALAEVATKTGIRLMHVSLSDAIATVTEY